MSTTIFATVDAKPETIHQVEEALRRMIALTRAEPGCLRYELFGAEDHPGAFYLLETYSDDAALASHHASAHFAALVVNLAGKLAQDIRIERFVSLPQPILA